MLKLIIGRSGSGKNYLCDKFAWHCIPSYTTRPQRKREINGNEHLFITIDDWNNYYSNVTKGAYTFFNKHHYFSTIEQINDLSFNTYIIDSEGLDYLFYLKQKKEIKRAMKVYYIKSSWYVRLFRMIKRDGIKKAINRFFHDIKAFLHFSAIIQKHNIIPTIIKN